MKAAIILKGFIGMFFITCISQRALAKEGSPVCNVLFNYFTLTQIPKDTIPTPKKNNENSNNKPDADVANKPAADIIKEVPKARRQTIPIPVKLLN
jgi:hypothetical protein